VVVVNLSFYNLKNKHATSSIHADARTGKSIMSARGCLANTSKVAMMIKKEHGKYSRNGRGSRAGGGDTGTHTHADKERRRKGGN
jgi:hypothetical protein